ncbi:Phosphonate ABC transporter ATP-binding protein PtxA (TC 3.A.1.9.1) [hydrothermal vent metagenome]|uniref:Phosphonate ABC transporter ATP-binding protein PtxA (TC 3.A.1.9.1) n=1 Tax=hydrothermal vent metagenome TaxID=652676 RepID=A0A3B0ZU16_9ZZZZ
MIQLNKVSVAYNNGKLIALYPITIEFHRGEFTVLLGTSGAGKTTLLRSINLLNIPTSGEVSVAGVRIDNAQVLRNHRRNTAMIFQQHQLIGRQNALRNVLAGRLGYYSSLRSLLPMREEDRRRALHCLERVGLLEKALERVDCLSGGQQQRVGIARALVQQPKVMLADEPVASLDPARAHEVMSLLQRICAEDGITIVVSLHQVELAKAYAQRIVALAEGRVIFDGRVNEFNADISREIYQRQD